MDSIKLYTEKEIINEIRIAVRSRRIAIGCTQSEVAARSGLSLRTVQGFESDGVITLPNLVKLLFVYRMEKRIADAFSDQTWWKMDEVTRAQKKVRVRHGR